MEAEVSIWIPPIVTGFFTVAVAVYASIETARKDQKRALDERFVRFEKVIEDTVDSQRREFGEALLAFREKTHQIEAKHQDLELYIRDNYVNKSDFREIKQSMQRIEAKIDQWFRSDRPVS